MSHGRTSWDPKRWVDGASDAPPALQPGLRDAQTLDVDPNRVAKLAERLGVGGGAAGLGVGVMGSSAAAVEAAVPASGVVAYKLWAYLSGAVALSGFSLFVWSEATTAAPPETNVAEVIALQESVTPVAEPAKPELVGTLAAQVGVEPVILDANVKAPVSDPVAQPSSRGASTVAVTENRPASPRRAAPEASSKARAALDPRAELAILNVAQDALAQAPRRALTLAEDHAEKFPEGVFAQEREVIAIGALLKLQRSDDATSRGRAFLAAFPTSTHAPRVQQMLGE